MILNSFHNSEPHENLGDRLDLNIENVILARIEPDLVHKIGL